jgi:glycyl-tRNA synthetase
LRSLSHIRADRQPDWSFPVAGKTADRMDTIVSLAKRRGLVFPSSVISGGLRASWDYAPPGV